MFCQYCGEKANNNDIQNTENKVLKIKKTNDKEKIKKREDAYKIKKKEAQIKFTNEMKARRGGVKENCEREKINEPIYSEMNSTVKNKEQPTILENKYKINFLFITLMLLFCLIIYIIMRPNADEVLKKAFDEKNYEKVRTTLEENTNNADFLKNAKKEILNEYKNIVTNYNSEKINYKEAEERCDSLISAINFDKFSDLKEKCDKYIELLIDLSWSKEAYNLGIIELDSNNIIWFAIKMSEINETDSNYAKIPDIMKKNKNKIMKGLNKNIKNYENFIYSSDIKHIILATETILNYMPDTQIKNKIPVLKIKLEKILVIEQAEQIERERLQKIEEEKKKQEEIKLNAELEEYVNRKEQEEIKLNAELEEYVNRKEQEAKQLEEGKWESQSDNQQIWGKYYTASGTYKIDVSVNGSSNFALWFGKKSDTNPSLLVNETGTGNYSNTFTIPSEGYYILTFKTRNGYNFNIEPY